WRLPPGPPTISREKRRRQLLTVGRPTPASSLISPSETGAWEGTGVASDPGAGPGTVGGSQEMNVGFGRGTTTSQPDRLGARQHERLAGEHVGDLAEPPVQRRLLGCHVVEEPEQRL